MKKVMTWFVMFAACTTLFAAESKGLKKAEVTAVVNDVNIMNPAVGATQPAKVKDVVSGKTAVNTGVKSRAELMFDDKTLARLGSNTTFSFEQGTRVMNLKNGTMLLQVPKNVGGATIHTAAVTAAIVGTTIMIHYQPGQATKVIVLEGTLRLYLKGKMDDFITIKPGQMIHMNPNSKSLPEPMDLDLKALVKTSDLVNGFGSKNLDMTLVREEIANQQNEIKDSRLVFLGKGQNTLMDTAELMSRIDQAVKAHTTPNQNNSSSSSEPPSGGGGSYTVGH